MKKKKSRDQQRMVWDWEVENPSSYTYKPWPLNNLDLSAVCGPKKRSKSKKKA